MLHFLSVGVKLVLLRIVVAIEYYPKGLEVLLSCQSDGIFRPNVVGFVHYPKGCATQYAISQRANFVGLFGHDIAQCLSLIHI